MNPFIHKKASLVAGNARNKRGFYVQSTMKTIDDNTKKPEVYPLFFQRTPAFLWWIHIAIRRKKRK
jgi:hypothetical protein